MNAVDPTGRQTDYERMGRAIVNSMTNANREVDDPVTEQRLNELDPVTENKARAFINSAETYEGATLRITQGERSYEEQDALFAQGRTTDGDRVTNARGGESYHNFGRAIDVVPLDEGGSPDWSAGTIDGGWERLGELGEDQGLDWGGNWNSFQDRPHFEDPRGQSVQELDDARRAQ